jgi:hypothetical protein
MLIKTLFQNTTGSEYNLRLNFKKIVTALRYIFLGADTTFASFCRLIVEFRWTARVLYKPEYPNWIGVGVYGVSVLFL